MLNQRLGYARALIVEFVNGVQPKTYDNAKFPITTEGDFASITRVVGFAAPSEVEGTPDVRRPSAPKLGPNTAPIEAKALRITGGVPAARLTYPQLCEGNSPIRSPILPVLPIRLDEFEREQLDLEGFVDS